MTSLAITVVGHDRTGIIADAAQALADCAMNLEDSSMTLLRGHFAMTLICSGAAGPDRVRTALQSLASTALDVTVREVADEDGSPRAGSTHLITVHGADRLGIVAQLTRIVAQVGGNVTDLSTRLSGGLYVLLAEVDLPATADLDDLRDRIDRASTELGVEATLRTLENDDL